MQSREFVIKRDVLPFVRGAAILRVDEAGIHSDAEAYPFYVFKRSSHLMDVAWDEIRDIAMAIFEGKEYVQIVPVKPARFIRPISKKGVIKIRLKVDDDGNWLIRWNDAAQMEDFFNTCRQWLAAVAR
jgi:hypothetical protein